MLDKCKAQLKVLKNKEEREELQNFINLFDELEIKKSNKSKIEYKGLFKPKNKTYDDCIILKILKIHIGIENVSNLIELWNMQKILREWLQFF